jgi:hypothetical protein
MVDVYSNFDRNTQATKIRRMKCYIAHIRDIIRTILNINIYACSKACVDHVIRDR